jgi:hypothetical protein
MTALRVIVGLMIAFVVSTINGFSGIGYVVGGEFEISMQAAVGNEAKDDSRWETKEDGAESAISPRDGLAALSLLLESKFGKFGLVLQVLCLLQLIGGLLVVFRPTAGATAFAFLVLLAIAGIVVEVIGTRFSSTWGVTNVFGIIVSAMLVPVAFHMYRAINRRDETQEAA